MRFTQSEKTVKKYKTSFALAQARDVLRDKYGLTQVCTDTTAKYSKDVLFTTEEVSQVISDLIDDTLYYDSWKVAK